MQSTFEWRRNAPGHFWGRAANARLSAAALWHLLDGGEFAAGIADEIGYGFDASIAYFEAFLRESALAIELIVKAVVAQQMTAARVDPATEGVPATHNIPALWAQAGLPELDREGKYRLLLFKSVLIWAGRYATPRTVGKWEQEIEEFAVLDPPEDSGGRIRVKRPVPCGWPEFDHLYQLADKRLSALQARDMLSDWGAPRQAGER